MENGNRFQSTRRQTIEQERSREAWNDIESIMALRTSENPEDRKVEKKYRTFARKLNAMIQTNGLGQTLAFHFAKSKPPKERPNEQNAHYRLLEHLSNWMHDRFSKSIESNRQGLLKWVTREETTSEDYRRATAECLAFGLWLSRFAEAELEEAEGEEE